MFQQSSYSDKLTFFQKLRSFDFILVFCVLILGVISNLSMYSTDGGEFLYHSRSHFLSGIFYTVGTIFYSLKNIKFSHAIWHLFVLFGSACHYFVVLLFII